MRSISTSLIAIGITTVAFIGLGGIGVSPVQADLLKNNGFENSTNSSPDFWRTANDASEVYVTGGTAGDNVHQGSAAVSLVEPGDKDRWFADTGNRPTLDPGTQYTISGFLKAQNFDSDDVGRIRIQVGSGGSQENFTVDLEQNTSDFVKISETFTPTSGGTAFTNLEFRNGANNTTGTDATVTFDDVQLVPEPGSLALIGVGGLLLLPYRRRR